MFAVSIAKHAARHCARTKKHCSTPNYTGVVLTLSDKTAERRQRTGKIPRTPGTALFHGRQ